MQQKEGTGSTHTGCGGNFELTGNYVKKSSNLGETFSRGKTSRALLAMGIFTLYTLYQLQLTSFDS